MRYLQTLILFMFLGTSVCTAGHLEYDYQTGGVTLVDLHQGLQIVTPIETYMGEQSLRFWWLSPYVSQRRVSQPVMGNDTPLQVIFLSTLDTFIWGEEDRIWIGDIMQPYQETLPFLTAARGGGGLSPYQGTYDIEARVVNVPEPEPSTLFMILGIIYLKLTRWFR